MLLCTVATVLALNGAAQAVTLPEALRMAGEVDPGIESLRQQVSRATTDIESERDALRPSLNIAGETNSTATNGPKLTLTVSQVLFDWGLAKSKIEAASQERVKIVVKLKMAVEDLALTVSGLFLDVEIIDRKLDRTNEYVAFARRLEGFSRTRVAAGLSDAAEIARARLEIARAEDQLAQLTADRAMAMAELEFYLGTKVTTVEPAPQLQVITRFNSSADIITAVLGAPDYIAAKADVQIAQAGIKKVRAATRPTIVLQAQGKQALSGSRSRSSSVGIATQMDFDAGNFSGRASRAAQQDLAAAEAELRATERQLQNQARSFVEQIKMLAVTEAAQQRQLSEARQVLDVYEDQFIGGKRDLLDILTTGRDLYDAQIDEIETYDTRKRAEYEAAHSMGMLGSLVIASQGRK